MASLRIILTSIMIIGLGITTGILLTGKLLPTQAAEQQYNSETLSIAILNVVVHAHDDLSVHEHKLLTTTTIKETTTHGYSHGFASTMIPDGTLPFAGSTRKRGANEVWADFGQFIPGVLTVPVGTTVTWINIDPQYDHWVTFENGLFDQDLTYGASINYTFAQAGTFAYYCEPHYGMIGTIIVK